MSILFLFYSVLSSNPYNCQYCGRFPILKCLDSLTAWIDDFTSGWQLYRGEQLSWIAGWSLVRRTRNGLPASDGSLPGAYSRLVRTQYACPGPSYLFTIHLFKYFTLLYCFSEIIFSHYAAQSFNCETDLSSSSITLSPWTPSSFPKPLLLFVTL